MGIFALVLIFALISFCLIIFAKIVDSSIKYDTIFCHDVRAQLGMIVYKSDLEEKRKKLKSPYSKF